MKRSKPAASLVALLGLVLAATTACSTAPSAGSGNIKDQTLRASFGPEPKHIMPQRSGGNQIAMSICEPLTEEPDGGGPISMLAAESIASPDQQHWTIKLRSGRSFQNGEPVTAASFVDAWNATAYGPNGWETNDGFTSFAGYDAMNNGDKPAKTLSGTKVVDDHTIQVELTSPKADFPKMLSYTGTCPMPKAGLADPNAYDKAPIGNGPYKFVRWDHNQQVVVQRWDQFQGRKFDAKEIDFKIYQGNDTAYRDLQAGQLDEIRNLPPNLLKDAKSSLGDQGLTRVPQSEQIVQLLFPDYVPALKDPRLRQALSLVIDRQAITRALFQGGPEPAYSLMSNAVGPAYRTDACKSCVYDPAHAKELVAQAGGFTAPIELLYPAGGTANSDLALVAQAIQNSVRQNLGAEVRLKPMLQSELTDAFDHQKLTGPGLQLWGISYNSPDEFLGSFRTGSPYTGYSNSGVDKLMDQALAQQEPQAAAPYWQQAEDKILADMPGVPIYYPGVFVAHNKCVQPSGFSVAVRLYEAKITCPLGK